MEDIIMSDGGLTKKEKEFYIFNIDFASLYPTMVPIDKLIHRRKKINNILNRINNVGL